MKQLSQFREVWFVDFEFKAGNGERPEPICLVAREYFSKRLIRVWPDELTSLSRPPYAINEDTLFVAYYASAEVGCHLALGWPVPVRILDLFTEFSCLTSGLQPVMGRGLLGAMAYFGLNAVDGAEKDSMRNLAIRGGPFTEAEQLALLDYCQSDVDALNGLLPKMASSIDFPRALLRGRYMTAVARMEWTGTPIDLHTWSLLRENWSAVRLRLIAAVDRTFGVYDGETFKVKRFEEYLIGQGIKWPKLESGALCLDGEAFKARSRVYPRLQPLHELRRSLSALRQSKLAVGRDGRNRCMLSAFGTKTGRNAPSTTQFIYGLPAWTRALIKPEPGRAVAYVDFEQQEFGIAAALSGDEAMMAAYKSGDPYLSFAKQAGAVPRDATKATHPAERDQFKVCALAVQYGMGSLALSHSLGQPESKARSLLQLHRETYPRFWLWIQAAVDHAMLHGRLYTVFGWRVHVGEKVNARSMMNFPMQANGAEMLRLACCLLTERGINVCCPVHDAVLIEGPITEIDKLVEQTESVMKEASEIVLPGFPLRADTKIVRYPDRYMDERGVGMWKIVMNILTEL